MSRDAPIRRWHVGLVVDLNAGKAVGPEAAVAINNLEDLLFAAETRVERLRRIVHRYGDRVPMATCHRQDWQQEIDAAMEFVADNPEPSE